MRWMTPGAALLAFSLIAADDSNPATTPTPSHPREHEQLKAEAKKGNIDLLFVGDSLTWNWKKAGLPIWKEKYAPLKAANFGLGGDRTQHVLWRLGNGELEGIKPKVVVLLIGTNNIDKDKPEQIALGIKANIDLITTKLPDTKVLLLGLFPRMEKPDGRKRILVGKVNEIIAKFDDGKRVRYLDIGSKFLDKSGTLTLEITRDHLHLTDKGYKIWADAMQPTLDEMMK